MDKKDLIAFFQELRLHCDSETLACEPKTDSKMQANDKDKTQSNDSLILIEKLFENTEIDKLNIRRMYRYLDKNVKRDSASLEDEDDELDMD
jgi:hypothetical protein